MKDLITITMDVPVVMGIVMTMIPQLIQALQKSVTELIMTAMDR